MTRISRYIDNPPQILLWDVDEFVILFLGVSLGIFLRQLLVLGSLSVIVAFLLNKTKKTRSEGFFLHMLYWIGLINLKGIPSGLIRRMIE